MLYCFKQTMKLFIFKGTAMKSLTLLTPPLPPSSHKPPMWSQCAVVVGVLSLYEPELNSDNTHCPTPYMIGIRWTEPQLAKAQRYKGVDF